MAPGIELGPPTYRMEFELSQQEVHCVYDARTPDCLDKDPVTLKQLLPLLLIVGSRLAL